MDDLTAHYQRTIEVFDDIVTRLHLYDTIGPGETEKLALRNYALELLARMGVMNDGNRLVMLKQWLGLPMPPALKDVEKETDNV